MLYIVSTPIGNLKDITERALETLRNVSVIIAESPSDSMRLLNAYNIKGKKVIKYNERNKKISEKSVLDAIKNSDVAYISSAGTPGISDPGADLVKLARDNGVEVRVIPGASALVSAIALSGFRSREFTFVSFPPKKTGQLKKLFEKYAEDKTMLVFFESTYRIVKTVQVLEQAVPECKVCVAKEMTKIFEDYYVGNPREVLLKFKEDPKRSKGEFVVVIDFSD